MDNFWKIIQDSLITLMLLTKRIHLEISHPKNELKN
jgi:hypothetical protein